MVVTIKTAVLWDIKSQFEPHRRHITVFAAATMKNSVLWDIKPQFVLHRKHYLSATEPSRLLLCKI
jgi:ABC-type molybdate transport system substrate-binding protein